MLPSPSRLRARPPGLLTFGATSRSLSLRPEQLAPTPGVGSSRGFRTVGFPSACPPSYGASDSYPGRSDSCCTPQPFLAAPPLVTLCHSRQVQDLVLVKGVEVRVLSSAPFLSRAYGVIRRKPFLLIVGVSSVFPLPGPPLLFTIGNGLPPEYNKR